MSQKVASLYAEITANTSGLDAGLAKAKAGVNGLAADLNKAGSASTSYGGKLNSLGDGFLGIVGKVAAYSGAIGTASALLQKLYSSGKEGAELDYTAKRFDRLTTSIGGVSDSLLQDMKEATRGTVTDFGLMKQGADLFQLGLANNSEEAVRFSKVMTALGMDTGELVLAVANQSKRRLDQLGLSLTEFNKQEAKFKDEGLSKEEAFKMAFLATAEATIETVGNKADESIGSYARLTTSFQNYNDAYKSSLSDTFVPFNETIAKGVNYVTNMMVEQNKAKSVVKEVGEMMGYSANQIALFNRNTSMIPKELQSGITEFERWQRHGTAWAEALGRTGQAAIEIVPDYESLLAVGLDVTKMISSYDEKQTKLNATLDEATQKYGENSEQVDAIKSKMGELEQAHSQAFAAMNLDLLKSKGATAEMQLQYAEAAGLIDERSAAISAAMLKAADAHMSGALSATAYNDVVKQLATQMGGMDGKGIAMFIDVYIRVHGEMPSGFAQPINVNVQGDRGSNQVGSRNLRQIGGPVLAGNMYRVNEGGQPEMLSVGGKDFLLMGQQGGYVKPAGSGGQSSDSSEAVAMIAARIPSARETAKALAAELAKVFA